MNQKQCPACGEVLEQAVSQCPVCGLQGLDQAFSGGHGYDQWRQTVLEPHLDALAPRVFAGDDHGLILTHSGDLYGIGGNQVGQIDKHGMFYYEAPHLIARDVISAAASSYYSIWITGDGQVHLTGQRGNLRQFTGFSNAREVYAELGDRFWIVDREDRIWGVGYNEDERIQAHIFDGDDVTNWYIDTPVLCQDREWMLHTPYRNGSMPYKEETDPNIKKKDGNLRLLTDGTVTWEDRVLSWLTEPVADIASSDNYCCSCCCYRYYYALSCRNGDVLWCRNRSDFEKGTMERICLPKTVRRRCPACGEALAQTASQCPGCGLQGLDQVFLSEEAYELWKQRALEPHIRAMAPRVFAGGYHGLILTHSGDLYGIGSNREGQIDEHGKDSYDTPHLMAREVISAAAAGHYSIWVTGDGQVHLSGFGEYADRFTGFSNAREVYAEKQDRFWIVDREDRIWGFGYNGDEKLQPEEMELLHRFEKAGYRENYQLHCIYDYTGSYPVNRVGYKSSETWWLEEDGETATQRLTSDRIASKPLCAKYQRMYGRDNVYVGMPGQVVSKSDEREETGEYISYGAYKYKRYYTRLWFETGFVEPAVYRTNRALFTPVLCQDREWMLHTPHRYGSMPEEYVTEPYIKKRAGYLYLLTDGTVNLDNSILSWLTEPAVDIGNTYRYCYLLSCRNGTVLWADEKENVETGNMKEFRF